MSNASFHLNGICTSCGGIFPSKAASWSQYLQINDTLSNAMLGNDSKLLLLFPLPLQVVYGICIIYVRVSSVMKKGNSKTSDNLYLAMISTAASFLSIARTQARLLSLFSSDMASLKFSGLSAVENRKAIRFLNGLTKSISDVFFSGTDNISAISLSFQKTE